MSEKDVATYSGPNLDSLKDCGAYEVVHSIEQINVTIKCNRMGLFRFRMFEAWTYFLNGIMGNTIRLTESHIILPLDWRSVGCRNIQIEEISSIDFYSEVFGFLRGIEIEVAGKKIKCLFPVVEEGVQPLLNYIRWHIRRRYKALNQNGYDLSSPALVPAPSHPPSLR